MAYAPGYENFDGYGHGPPLSRRQSLAYGGTPYSHQGMYGEPLPHDYPQPSYPIYGPSANSALVPVSRRLTGPPYDDMDIHDPYYGDHIGSMTPMMRTRSRRHSTVSFASRPTTIDSYHHRGSIHINFKRRGSFTAGIGLDEAQSRVHLSSSDSYSLHDLHADGRRKILLKVRWAGYSSMTYEIPLDCYDGRVDLETLARRVSRACVHYLQANVVPIVWNRVRLHHLEEVSYGVWQPMLSSF